MNPNNSSFSGNPARETTAPTMQNSGRASFGAASGSSFSMKWAALHDAAKIVATLARVETEKTTTTERNFPAIIKDAGGWRLEAAQKGLQDLSAIMEPGIAALLAVNARGADASAPARSLWNEFATAKQALLGLAPETGDMGPRRSA